MSYSPLAFNIATLGTSQTSKFVSVDSNGDLIIPDSDKFKFGSNSDMQMYHNDTDAYITNSKGILKLATESSGIAITIGNATSEVTVADNLTVSGNLTVTGTTTTVDVELINTANGVIFEGATANDFETTLIAADPSADRIWTIPDSASDTIVGLAATQTLTNKTLTSPVLNTGVSGTAIKDEDNMSSDSATHLATQQSIKAYVDASGGGVTLSGSTNNTIATVTGSSALAGEASLTYDDTNGLKVTSSTASKPIFTIENTNNGATSGYLKFVNDKGGAGADNDVCGTITFYGDDDNQDNIEFARIEGVVADASNGDECGGIKLYVAENDGTNTVGLAVTGSTTDGEVDVTIGAGAASVITIPGVLNVTGTSAFTGNADFDGTVTCDTSITIDTTTITAAEIGVIDSVTAGTAAASKALVLDASTNIATIGTVGCGAITSTGTSVFGDITVGGGYGSTGITVSSAGVIQANGAITSDGVVTATGFTIGSAAINETELEIIDGCLLTTTELNIIDGDTSATGTTLVDADRVVVNDNGTMVQVAVDDLREYMSNVETITASTVTASKAITLCNTTSNTVTVTITDDKPAGTKYTIKMIGDGSNNVTITRSSADTFDGSTSLTLYHLYESVTLVSDGANYHIV